MLVLAGFPLFSKSSIFGLLIFGLRVSDPHPIPHHMRERGKNIVSSTPPSLSEFPAFLIDLMLSLDRPKVGKKSLAQLSDSLACPVGGPGPLSRIQ